MDGYAPHNTGDLVKMAELQKVVGEWSQANFGDQESKSSQVRAVIKTARKDGKIASPNDFDMLDIRVALGSLAPMLGICEEVGELWSTDDDDEQKDGCGDIMVYLCDYSCRENDPVDLSHIYNTLPRFQDTDWKVDEDDNYESQLVAAMGDLCHCTLKRLQGIRRMDDPIAYANKRNDAIRRILLCVDCLCLVNWETDAVNILQTTWDNVVSKRDWKKNPEEGA